MPSPTCGVDTEHARRIASATGFGITVEHWIVDTYYADGNLMASNVSEPSVERNASPNDEPGRNVTTQDCDVDRMFRKRRQPAKR